MCAAYDWNALNFFNGTSHTISYTILYNVQILDVSFEISL